MKYEIIFFDATEARRERMRSGGARKAEPRQIATVEVVKSDEFNPSPSPSRDVDKTPTPKSVPGPAALAKEVSVSELDAYLVNFVVEQTGYPEDMVDLDADLEGDLGIDSIKKAQLLGELNEKFHFSTADDMSGATSFDDFATLRSIRDFIVKRLGAAPHSSFQSSPIDDSKSTPVEREPIDSSATSALSSARISVSELDSYLVNFVVEQTGYPEDMVDLDADLEGDLGIDSIKKAQLLGELNEKFHFSTADDMSGATSFDDFATLRSIRDFIVKRLEDAHASSLQDVASSSSATSPIENNRKEILDYLTRFVADQTGYPEDMIGLDLDLGADLGVDSIKKAQLFAEIAEMYSAYPLANQSLEDFNTLGQIYEAVVKEL